MDALLLECRIKMPPAQRTFPQAARRRRRSRRRLSAWWCLGRILGRELEDAQRQQVEQGSMTSYSMSNVERERGFSSGDQLEQSRRGRG